ncbi:ribonucleotide-diphosphate reductase subunit alpha [Ochrobactrum phage vB_OspM_OC]|nr:ribonucleotide-diphosphate reductase subunit alpha [Ochrobactrum phage vB_OspM_OC]
MSINNDFYALNAMLNIVDENGKIQFEKDKEAVKAYFIEHVNTNTVFFHDLEEKIDHLIKNDFYDDAVFLRYNWDEVKELYKKAYAYKFRFPTYMGAMKFYSSYALKTTDGKRYLERYEDRVVVVALALAEGNMERANDLVDEMITGRYQPATPTFLNAGRKNCGELVSCFLIRTEDNMESISHTINAALQLSKRGGGVGISLTNLRESGAPIKKIKNASSGVIPVMKILEDSFSYANQLGQRQGAGAVYIHAHHPDIMKVLDTKRENADEKIRIKTLSLGIVIPDITFELAKRGEDMFLFSPYDIKRVYGKDMTDISITEMYQELVDNPEITKKKIDTREFFKVIAEVQTESGYPYLMFEDTVNAANPIDGRISMSNLCSEILQVSTASTYKDDGSYDHTGRDISCNLGSLNIAKAMEGKNLGKTVEIAVRALTAVSDASDIVSVPSVAEGNKKSHSIGLGQMNLHGFFGKEGLEYGDKESIDFTNIYFYTVAYHAIKTSMEIAKERGETFYGFKNSKYATGEYFEKYIDQEWKPETQKVVDIFEKYGIVIPNQYDWAILKEHVQKYGMYNAYLQAIPPTGSISYINNSTASIHPITAKIEARKEGKIGRVYYPAPYMTNENTHLYKDAFEIGHEKLIDIYAAATQHVDQGLSLTVFFKDTATTRDINKAQIYAWKSGIKTTYYMRVKQEAVKGTENTECVSCQL